MIKDRTNEAPSEAPKTTIKYRDNVNALLVQGDKLRDDAQIMRSIAAFIRSRSPNEQSDYHARILDHFAAQYEQAYRGEDPAPKVVEKTQ